MVCCFEINYLCSTNVCYIWRNNYDLVQVSYRNWLDVLSISILVKELSLVLVQLLQLFCNCCNFVQVLQLLAMFVQYHWVNYVPVSQCNIIALMVLVQTISLCITSLSLSLVTMFSDITVIADSQKADACPP